MIGVLFIPSLFIHFVMSFLKMKDKRSFCVINYVVSFCLSLFVYSPFYAKEGGPFLIFPYWAHAGLLFHIGLAHFSLLVGYSFFLMYRALQSATGAFRTQLLYVFICSLQGYLGGSLNYFGWYRVSILPVLNFTISLFVITMAYAIVRHNLMDIRVAVRKGVIYSFLVTAITLVYFICVWSAERIFQTAIGYQSVSITMFALLVIALFFQPIKNKTQIFVDRYFFRGTVDSLAEQNERLEEELVKGEKLRLAGTLASGIAHEIKNPLTSLKTFTSYLEEKHSDPSFRRKFKEVVGQEIDRIERLVRDLLHFAKPSSPQLILVDLHRSIDRAFELINTTLAHARISLVRDYHRPNTEIMGDASQLQQAFLNLFLNAMDAMPNGGELRISTETDDGWLKIKIEDTGVGMTKEQLDHIFEPFYTTKESGTGLGLAITKRIIEDHKGKIKVTSQVNKGTIFEISLPLCS